MTETHSHHHESTPSRFLAENIHLLPKGRVLDLAMGHGRNAIYLAQNGFAVEGLDISTEAVNTAIEKARQEGVVIHAEVADLEQGYRIPPETYDVIIVFNYLQRSLMPQVKGGLRQGGMLVYETFIVDQAQFGKPQNPDFLLKHNELLNWFRDFRCLRYHEGLLEPRRAVAGIVAQKTQKPRTPAAE